ncbi:initiation-specific alpha-1,6-mannosyltransferase [Staphylotrichum tortipilum]|uniref:Initiation-specific alpha-1,6-mannosyltransferase n=1 Tax=Staphylotrichum tortipilum TaxID=2831512 RepID=A0AAN6RPQ5_9PEZI|nr:initiation-specific alpha-1,6-mannosyltransferase [Staphylotrichum longicolle]
MNWKPASSSGSVSPLSPLSPLSSPMLSNLPGKLRNRVPTQLRRALVVGAVLLFLVFRTQLFPATLQQQPQAAFIKRQTSQKTLGRPDPASQPTDFPKKIWQSWKTDPFNFDQRDSDVARTWTTKNPGHRYEVLTDHTDLLYVEEHFGRGSPVNRPDIVDFYRSVNATIIKADLLRYMIMYAEGGVYADIDVEALKPVDRFVPARYSIADVDMVIGVEIDQPEFRDHPILGQKCMSFCQWTFMCRPGLPVMLQLVENIMSWLEGIAAKQKKPVGEVELDFDQVISGTGPSAFTEAVMKEMNREAKAAGRKEVTWNSFHAMDESVLVGRVLVLNVEKFAAGQGHSDSGNHNARGALVKHHYHASNWPSKHPRYKHEVYGEVEHCNWDASCIRTWDENVAAYKLLSPDEQARILAQRTHEYMTSLNEAKKKQQKEQVSHGQGQAQAQGQNTPGKGQDKPQDKVQDKTTLEKFAAAVRMEQARQLEVAEREAEAGAAQAPAVQAGTQQPAGEGIVPRVVADKGVNASGMVEERGVPVQAPVQGALPPAPFVVSQAVPAPGGLPPTLRG